MSVIRGLSLHIYSLVSRVYWGRIFALITLICLLSVLFQLQLPDDVTTSRARAGNIDLVSMTSEQIESVFDSIEESSFVYLRVGDEQYIKKYTDLGIKVDTSKLQELASYNIEDKIIPFSALHRYVTDQAQEITFTYDSEVAKTAIEEIAGIEYVEPASAQLEVQGSQVAVVPHVVGGTINVEESLRLLGEVDYQDRLELPLQLNEIMPEITSEEVLPLAEEANTYITQAPILTTAEKEFQIPPGEMVTWFFMDTSNDEPKLSVDEDALSEYLDDIANELRLPSGNTKVTLLDGREVSRVEGKTGRVIDKGGILQRLKQNLTEGKPERSLEITFKTVSPSIDYTNTYSESSGGLATLLADIGKRSGDYKISVHGLDQSVTASYRGGTVTAAASTYKVYVAYYLYLQIENGSLDWSDKLPSGRQLDYCLDQMIVISSNSCALEVRDFLGSNNINNQVKAAGLSTTVFSTGYAQTTANDLTRFMQKLANGQLVNSAHTDQLLGMMRRQIHRLAIPTGVAPAAVADKGGFFSGFNNDTGIVYGNNGSYAITIMARNESKSDLANVAREIHQYMEAL